jgi:hypothetical protein
VQLDVPSSLPAGTPRSVVLPSFRPLNFPNPTPSPPHTPRSHLRDLLVDEERTDALIREHNGLYVDFSRQNVTETTLQVGAAGWRPCAWAWKAANEGGGGGEPRERLAERVSGVDRGWRRRSAAGRLWSSQHSLATLACCGRAWVTA